MTVPYFVADAFVTDKPFSGNPAGVCLLESWPSDAWMQQAAAENNLAETAFLVPRGEDYELRWFTPAVEIDLCGHATLASAFVLARRAGRESGSIVFHSKSGALPVSWTDGLFELDFPSRPPKPVAVTEAMRKALNAEILEAHQARDLVLVLPSEEAVAGLSPDLTAIAQWPDILGVAVTAPGTPEREGKAADFVSRFFVPAAGIPEDPVTGSSHATLTPFWAARLGKADLTARQLSARGGELRCRLAGDRVKIAGRARLYLEGRISSWKK